MKTSGILDVLFAIHKVSKNEASHFAIKNNNKIRYLIDMRGGTVPLSKNISSYSYKLKILMIGIQYLPLWVLAVFKLGEYVKVDILPSVSKYLQEINCKGWNAIIGTYDEKQKVVLQCYENGLVDTLYVKIGNEMTAEEMGAEIEFLRGKTSFKAFQVPVLEKTFVDQDNNIQVQVTREFKGERVNTYINESIVAIYREIAEYQIDSNYLEWEFSHGDFAPWNLKKYKGTYIVFDWEHCGYRVKGFDLLHYAIMPKIKLEGLDLDLAIKKGLAEIREYLPGFHIDIDEFKSELDRIHLERR